MIEELALARGVLIFLRKKPRHSEGHPTGDNGNFVERVGVGTQMPHNRMPKFMVRGNFFLLLCQSPRAFFCSQGHLLHSIHQIFLGDGLVSAPRGENRRLIHDVFQIRPREPDGLPGNCTKVGPLRNFLPIGMDLENLLAGLKVRLIEEDATIEPTWPEERHIEHVRTIRRCHHNDVRPLLKAVHFRENLVQCLLPLVMSTAEPRAPTLPTHSINFIDENNAGSIALRPGKKIAHPTRSHSHEHLDEF